MTTPTTVNVRLQLRADTAANWTAANPTLLANEVGLETDTKKLKVGNGSSAWNSLTYFPSIVSGGTVLGNLEIGTTGTLTFEGSTADGFETTLAVTNPTADRTITLPNQSGTVVVSGNASIVDADIAAGAEIAVSKLANGTANQVLVTDGTNVSWSDDLTLAGNLTVNGTTTTINTQDLLVEDKNIIIGNVTTPDDTTANAGGITLKGATDKTINWYDATDAWTSSERFSVPLGSAASPSLTFTGDENTGIYSPGADQLALSTNGTERLRIDSTGQIEAVSLGTAAAPTFSWTGDPNTGIYSPDADQVAISTNGTGRLFVDASGNVGVGTSTPATLLHVDGGTITSQRYANNGAIILRRAEGTQASPTAIASSTGLSNIVSRGYDGSSYKDAASIQVFSDGAFSSTSSPGAILFGTTPSGSTTTQERLRITSAGLVGIGTSMPSFRLHTGIDHGTQSPSILWRGAAFQSAYTRNDNSDFVARRIATGATNYAGFIQAEDSAANAAFLALNPSGGNVGIGTTSPQAVLHLEKNQAAETGLFINNSDAGGYVACRFGNSDRGTNGDHLIYGGTVLGLRSKTTTAITFEPAGTERARIDSSGRLLVGTSSDSGGALLQVNGDRVRIATAKTPASASATGTAGEVCWDTNYIYVCTATNTWKRAALSTW